MNKYIFTICFAVVITLFFVTPVQAWYFSDNFDSYDNLDGVKSNWSYVPTSNTALDPAGGYGGSKAVKFIYSGENFLPLEKSITAIGLDHIFIRFRFKVDANPVGGIKYLKIFGVVKENPTSYANWTWNFGPTTASPSHLTAACYGGGGELQNDTAVCIYPDGRVDGPAGNVSLAVTTQMFSPVAGQWHEVSTYNRYSTNGNSDGEMWMDIDGIRRIHVRNQKNRNDDNVRIIDRVSFADYSNPNARMVIWYDNIEMSDSPFGSCTPSWTCTDFGACQNGTQSRTCTDQNNCGITTNRPALTQTCTVIDPTLTTITVDSTYSGYSKDRIDDDIKNASGMEAGTWASGDSAIAPHWIEFSFPQAKTINYVDIYWAYNPSRNAYMSSQDLQVQYWNGSSYVTAVTINNSGSVEKSTVSFNQISTAKLRLYQNVNQGYGAYPGVLWLTEVDYGQRIQSALKGDLNNDNSVNVTDLGILLGNWNTAPCPEPCRGDINQDGKVDVTDLGVLLSNWG